MRLWRRSVRREHRAETLVRLGQELHRANDHLQLAFPDAQGPEYWYWLMWHGATDYPAVRSNLYPLPETFLRDRVVGEGVSEESFHRGGLVDWRELERGLRAGGYDFGRLGSLLDFGCGCARTLRFFGCYATTTRFAGVDVDADALNWCRDHIDFADFVRVDFFPPSPFAPETFAGVMSFSVFSHLSERLHLQWLEELHRITMPGAVLVLSTQGERVMRTIMDHEREDLFPCRQRLAAALDVIQSKGFAFFPYVTLQMTHARNRTAFANWPSQAYGSAFVLEPFIRERWGRWFEIVEYRQSPDGWQDFTILRRR